MENTDPNEMHAWGLLQKHKLEGFHWAVLCLRSSTENCIVCEVTVLLQA
jgi:hypothetical protein